MMNDERIFYASSYLLLSIHISCTSPVLIFTTSLAGDAQVDISWIPKEPRGVA